MTKKFNLAPVSDSALRVGFVILMLLAVSLPSFAQTGGSAFSIPGVTSRMNTDEMVDELMDAERIPLARMEAELERHQDQREAWAQVGRSLSSLRDAARRLYGFENPFNDRSATSDNPDILTATATRDAPEGEMSLVVRQTAARDRFLSRSLPLDFEVPEGRYGFRLGDQEEYVRFRGGSVEDFVARVNDQAEGLIRLSTVRNTADTQVILFEGLDEGAANALVFLEEAEDLALSAGVLRRIGVSAADLPVTESTVGGWTDGGGSAPRVSDQTLILEPSTAATLRGPSGFTVEEGMVLEFEAAVTDLGEPAWTPPTPPPGPDVPDAPAARFGDITVESIPSQVDLPPWQEPSPPRQVTDFQVVFAGYSDQIVPLPDLRDTEGFRSFRVPITDFVPGLSRLYFRNRNTYRRVEIRNVRVFDPDARGDFEPLNPISVARDAQLELNGIPVTRPTNTIDDLVPGTTFELHRASGTEVLVTVAPDRDRAKEGIIEFVGLYNSLLTRIHILTRDNEAIVDEIEYFTEEERESALEQLGLLQGDSTLATLRSRLQTIMMDPYGSSASAGSGGLALLAQIGVSTNAASPGARNFDAARLRGYLEINEPALDQALAGDFTAVRRLFGSDSNGDLVIDTGVAFAVQNFVGPFVQSGGIVATRNATLDNMISQSEERIEDFNERLVEVEADYRSDFAEMEGAMENLQRNSQSLQNLQTGGNR